MSVPAASLAGKQAFLLLEAGGFEFLLPIERVDAITEITEERVHVARGRRRIHHLGEVAREDGQGLPLHSLGALAGADERALLPGGTFEVVQVEVRGEPRLLYAGKVGSIEEYGLDESWPTPPLLWGRQHPWSPRAWPGISRLRWEIDPDSFEL